MMHILGRPKGLNREGRGYPFLLCKEKSKQLDGGLRGPALPLPF